MIKTIKRTLSVNWMKTIFINLYYFPLPKACHFPILLGYDVKISALGKRGSLVVPSKFASLCFSLKRGPFSLGANPSFWHIGNNSRFEIKGTCRFSKGTSIKIFDNAVLSIDNGFSSNANLIISCANRIDIGEDCLMGWNITLMDNDGGHKVIVNGVPANETKAICIGNHVWIGAESSILKGSCISDYSIVGFKSNVCGINTSETNSLILGNPASVKRTGVNWEH